MNADDVPTSGRSKRTVWGWIGFLVNRVLVLGLCWVVLVMVGGGLYMAWLDLTGPHCDRQLMRPGDTCSTLWVRSGRSTKQLEQLNPPGAVPAVLDLPGYRHPEPIVRGVYDVDGMRHYHRWDGLGGLALAALPTIAGISIWRQRRKGKQAQEKAALDPAGGTE